ncbi:MAG: 50S ribosomal protein L32 [Saprospiraceae bacterium]|nr:50S ribosomal protein L32 [Saprospiraceae bacterium]
MPNPRNRHSKQRKRTRRAHDHAEMPQLATCKNTNETHIYHRAYTHEGALYYRGRVLVPAKVSESTETE